MSSQRVYDHRPLASLGGSLPPPPLASTSLALQQQQPPLLPVPAAASNSHPSAQRLGDLLEFVRSEFEQVTSESGALRAQREEYEAMSESPVVCDLVVFFSWSRSPPGASGFRARAGELVRALSPSRRTAAQLPLPLGDGGGGS